jgi:energy-coupling factor transport system permease protein
MFTLSGDTVFELGGLFATREGLITGLVLSAKIVLMLWTSLIFVSTTTIPGVIDAMETLGRPFRKRLGPVIMVMNLTLNFVPSLVHTAQRIKIAQIARGADLDSGFSRQLHFAFSAALPLFASAFRSSEQLALAMESRCYDPSIERSHFSTLRMAAPDWLVAAGIFCCLAVFTLSSLGQ